MVPIIILVEQILSCFSLIGMSGSKSQYIGSILIAKHLCSYFDSAQEEDAITVIILILPCVFTETVTIYCSGTKWFLLQSLAIQQCRTFGN